MKRYLSDNGRVLKDSFVSALVREILFAYNPICMLYFKELKLFKIQKVSGTNSS